MQREIIRIKQENNDRIMSDKQREGAEAKIQWLEAENSRINDELRYCQQQLEDSLQNL